MSKQEQRSPKKKTVYGRSQTIPGQALVPAELLKRHLAGTLPDIQKTPEFTYDEDGSQISEDLSRLELHELHDLARELRHEYDKRAKDLKSENEKAYRQQVIDDYKKEHDLLEAEKLKLKSKAKSPTAAKKEEPLPPNSPAPASL